MTDDLITWLRAQFDEDERMAGDVARIGLDTLVPSAIIDTSGATVFFAPDVYERVTRLLDPARMLAEVEAKRRLLEPHHDYGYGQCGECENDGRRDAPFPCLPARLLALPYADRPGYQEAWRP